MFHRKPTAGGKSTRVIVLFTLLAVFGSVIVLPSTASAQMVEGRDPFSTSIKSNGYATQVFEKVHHNYRTTVLLFDDQRHAEAFTNDLNKAFEQGEEDAKNGTGDASRPDPDGAFKVGQRIDGKWAVKYGGRDLAIYETEEEANTVANELNKAEKKGAKKAKKKNKSCIDPDVFGEEMQLMCQSPS